MRSGKRTIEWFVLERLSQFWWDNNAFQYNPLAWCSPMTETWAQEPLLGWIPPGYIWSWCQSLLHPGEQTHISCSQGSLLGSMMLELINVIGCGWKNSLCFALFTDIIYVKDPQLDQHKVMLMKRNTLLKCKNDVCKQLIWYMCHVGPRNCLPQWIMACLPCSWWHLPTLEKRVILLAKCKKYQPTCRPPAGEKKK